MTRYLQLLVFAIKNECLPIFKHLFKVLCEHMTVFAVEGEGIRCAALLIFRGMVYYWLMEFYSPMIRQFRSMAGFESLVRGAKMALK